MAIDSVFVQKKLIRSGARKRLSRASFSSFRKRKKWKSSLMWIDIAGSIFWMALIFFFSSQSGVAQQGFSDMLILIERKGAHFTEFFVLTIILYRVFRHIVLSNMESVRLSIAVATAYAFSDEIHQLFVPFREGKLSDVAVDGLGISIAYLVLMIYVYFYPKNRCISPEKQKK